MLGEGRRFAELRCGTEVGAALREFESLGRIAGLDRTGLGATAEFRGWSHGAALPRSPSRRNRVRPALAALGLNDTRRLVAARPGSRVRPPGLVLMRQRPGTAKGVVFVTVEDGWGHANLVVYADVGARDRAALVGARLLVAEGRVERETERAEVPITRLICRRLVDRSDLLDGLSLADGGDNTWAGRALGRADELRRPEPGSRPPSAARLPKSRDFR